MAPAKNVICLSIIIQISSIDLQYFAYVSFILFLDEKKGNNKKRSLEMDIYSSYD